MPYAILISKDQRDQEFVGAICSANGMDLMDLGDRNLRELRKLASPEALYFWNLDGPQPPLVVLGQTLLELSEPGRIFGIGDLSLNERSYVLKMRAIGHYLRRGVPTGEGLMSRLLALAISKDPFGIARLAHSNDEIRSIPIHRARDRNLASQAIANVMEQKKLPPRLAQLVGQSVDELIMNAIFDAPVLRGKHYRLEADRAVDFELSVEERVSLQMIVTSETILISVTDPFGSLQRGALLSYLAKDYAETAYRPREGAGAGLGIYGILDSGVSLCYAVAPGKKTQAMLVVPVVERFQDFRKAFQTFSAIELKGASA